MAVPPSRRVHRIHRRPTGTSRAVVATGWLTSERTGPGSAAADPASGDGASGDVSPDGCVAFAEAFAFSRLASSSVACLRADPRQ